MEDQRACMAPQISLDKERRENCLAIIIAAFIILFLMIAAAVIGSLLAEF